MKAPEVSTSWLASLVTMNLVLTVVLPIVLILAALALGVFLVRRKEKAAAASANALPGAAPAIPHVEPGRLRAAFKRFAAQLPADYRRSLLNFEHFVVLGATGSGKSRLIDQATDWKRRTKEFVSSQAVDPDLQVYLTSAAVVTELPPSILDDHSDACRVALRRLWKPLYKHRAPTVVVVVDVMNLAETTPEGIRDLAETVRSKVNLIASIRGASIEVRVVLTRLDQLDGYQDFVDFAVATGLPTRIPFQVARELPDVKGELDRWFEALRGHLSRALTVLPSDSFRRVVSFVRRLPEIPPTLSPFLEALFAPEPLARDLISGGVFLLGDSSSVSNPLKNAGEVGPGPDPQRKHLFIAATVGGLAVTYLTVAYVEQRGVWAKAAAEMQRYSASTYGTQREARHREGINGFTQRTGGVVLRFPDFFEGARTKMRKRFSDGIREEALIPRLRQIAQNGRTEEGGIALPQRRSLYYLALIHSDHDDRLKILTDPNLHIWASMTGLSPDLIHDYVSTVDVARAEPVEFDLAEHELDPSDSSSSWILFFSKTREAIADGVIEPAELRELRERSESLSKALDRFDHDNVTRLILDQLDDASGVAAASSARGARLKLAYQSKYVDFLQNIGSSDVLGQREKLRRIMRAVASTSIETSNVRQLRMLVDKIALLYATQQPARPEDAVAIKLANQDYIFDLHKWSEAIRNSVVGEEIAQFVRRSTSNGNSIFFSANDDEPRMGWNPTNDGSVLFTGKGSIEGRYTKSAYDKHVRGSVKKLSELLTKEPLIPDDRRRQLRAFVEDEVHKYAVEYRRQLTAFYRSFGLAASSPEALRVAVAQMVGDASPFNDFLVAVAGQATVECDDKLLDPMEEVVKEFAAWVAAVGPSAPELVKYKAILTQLLADLGPAPEASSAGPAAAAIAAAEPVTNSTGQTLEKALSPAGRLVLAHLRGEKGSYGSLVTALVASTKLHDYQGAPFLAPIVQLGAIGRRDIERLVEHAWETDMSPDVQRMAGRFPFARDATDDVSPQELAMVLHPQSGRLFDFYRRFIEPISESDASGYRLRKNMRGSINAPSGMYTTLSQAGALATRLWDSSGKPIPLDVHIATVPFEHGPDPRLALTLIYMNAGDTPVMNFNQKPTEKTVRFDWTKEQASQVGLQLTDLDTKESAFPDPLVIESSFWSLQKLLRAGTSSPVKFPPEAQLYTWELKVKKGRIDTMRVRFAIINDPFQPFQLTKSADSSQGPRGGRGRSATRPAEPPGPVSKAPR